MKKFILIPDSFKGTMSSAEICDIMKEIILKYFPHAEVKAIPVADGGEGSVDAFLQALPGEKVYVNVKGPYMEDMESFYGIIDNGNTAVIEMAACAGLPLVGNKLRPDKTTTYGVGELIAHALKRGCKKIILGIGGSATNDMGAGCAAALGFRFIKEDGNEFIPVGGTLGEISHIDTTKIMPELRNAEILTMFDIDNPLYGENGAAYVYAPQKGADPEMVVFLDQQLRKCAEVIKRDLGKDIADIPGSGAAGGMGGGMVAFLNSTLKRGIETVLDAVGFDALLENTDCVFTGEGKIDFQSLRGKVVIGVSRRCKKKGIPVIAIVGDIDKGIDEAYTEGVTAIFSTNRKAVPFSEAKKTSREDMKSAMDNIMRLLYVFNK
jgi:glycerate kinase